MEECEERLASREAGGTERDFGDELMRSPALARALAPGGLFVLEKTPGVPLPEVAGWECVRLKKYGSTEVAFLAWNPRDS